MPNDNDNDLQTLFPKTEKHGYEILPWSLGKLSDLSSEISKIIEIIKETGFISIKEDKNKSSKTEYKITIEKGVAFNFFTKALPFLSPLIAKSLDLPDDIVRGFPLHKAADILLGIFTANFGYLKNFLGLMMAEDDKPQEKPKDRA